MEDGLPDETSVYAARGTLGHWVAEQCLLDGGDPTRFSEKWYYVDDDRDPEEIDPTKWFQPFKDGQRVDVETEAEGDDDFHGFYFFLKTDYCEKMMKDLAETRELAEDGEIYIESRVPLDYPLGKGESGTADICLRAADGDIYVRDWKFGEGIKVEAENNEQLSLYAIGAIKKHWPDTDENTTVHIDILQPLVGNGEGGRWTTTVGDLYVWADNEVLPRIEEIHDPDRAKFAPSKKACRWCKARKGNVKLGRKPCEAHQVLNLKIARMAMPDLDACVELGLEGETELEPAENIKTLLFIMEHADLFKAWLKEVHDTIHDDLRTGRRKVPGKKLVPGRAGHRKFIESKTDEIEETVLGLVEKDEAFTTTMKSPSQLNDLLGDEVYDLFLKAFVAQSKPKAVIVDESNPKPRILSEREVLAKSMKGKQI